jgi:hypothetical protein
MPLPTSLPETPESAFQRVLATAQTVSTNLRGVGTLIANGGPVYMDNLIGLYQALNASQGVGLSIQGVEGLSDYAKTVLADPDYNIDADFMISLVACKAVTDWLLENMPSDGADGFVAWRKQDDGSIQRITVPVDQLMPLQSRISAALTTFA